MALCSLKLYGSLGFQVKPRCGLDTPDKQPSGTRPALPSEIPKSQLYSLTGELIMKQLQILGTGCPKCQKLTDQTQAAADALGLEYTLEKVTDIEQIMSFGVMMTPALAVDGEVKVMGKVPSVADLQKLLA
jgi:small redox-active disulfide protein 2